MPNPRRLAGNTNPPRTRRLQWIQRDAAERHVDQWVLLDYSRPTLWSILRFPHGDYRANPASRYALFRDGQPVGRYSLLFDAKASGAEEYSKEMPNECPERTNA